VSARSGDGGGGRDLVAAIVTAARSRQHVQVISASGAGTRADRGAYFNKPLGYAGHCMASISTGCADTSACCWCAVRASGEDTTGSLDSTRRFAGLLASQGIRHELDLWGHDVPHDWPSWRAQLAQHMPRFC
jgi:esterase/lipase superfamily enzyme